MVALQDQWQQLREQRQQEIQNRQRWVRSQLQTLHQQRRTQAMAVARNLKTFTATLQADNRRRQIDNQVLLSSIAADVQSLQLDVQAYLANCQQQRQQQATEQRQQRQQDRETLRDSVNQFIADLAPFRQSLKDHRLQLIETVWGLPALNLSVTEPTATTPASVPSRPVGVAAIPKSVQTDVPKAAVSSATVTTATSAPAPAPTAVPLTATEQAVVNYLKDLLEGAKVSEIEQTLGLQRLQTVDALRSLLQKSLIAQQDRMYFIQ